MGITGNEKYYSVIDNSNGNIEVRDYESNRIFNSLFELDELLNEQDFQIKKLQEIQDNENQKLLDMYNEKVNELDKQYNEHFEEIIKQYDELNKRYCIEMDRNIELAEQLNKTQQTVIDLLNRRRK